MDLGWLLLGFPRLGLTGMRIEILHYRKDPKLWEVWYIPYDG